MDTLNTLTKAKAPTLLSTCTVAVALFLAILSPYSAASAISQTPLFIQQRVQPNIMLLLDDSTSMKSEVMLYNSASCAPRCYLDFSPASDTTNLAIIADKKLKLCSGYNTLMYDPSKIYTPWVGEDSNGAAYPNADISEALENPFYRTNSSCTAGQGYSSGSATGACNLLTGVGPTNASEDQLGAFYYPWTDSDNDGTYDDGECATDDGDEIWVSSLDADDSGGNNDNQQNFANWFSYYRKGEYVMKRALSSIISESQERVGLATINQSTPVLTQPPRDSSYIGTVIADLDTRSLPVNETAVGNKQRLLRNLFRINPNGQTHLREALNNVGRYFDTGSEVGDDLFGFTPSQSPLLSPALGRACQQNFVIALSDGYWNGAPPTAPIIGNADANSGSLYDGQSYADGYSNTLADIAMHYYKMDLDHDSTNDKVPATSISPPGSEDDNPAQHLVTYTASFGLSGTIPFRSDSTPCYPSSRSGDSGWPRNCPGMPSDTPLGWPEPIEETATTIDDMLHAAWNGRGKFLSAANPQVLIKGLEQAIADITTRTSTTTAAAAVAVNSTNMRAGGVIYQAGFDPNIWSGQLFAYQLSGNIISQTPLWSAHTQLSELDDPQDNRVIITYNGDRGIPFAPSSFPNNYWNPDTLNNELSLDQIRDLLTHAPHNFNTGNSGRRAANRAHAVSLIEYIRGSSAEEVTNNGDFRPRNNNLLADIIHSAPVYVGSPNPAIYPDRIAATTEAANSYYAWATSETNTTRTPMVYVGTNGGGLHGFNASTGAEVFVYIPQSVFSDADHAGLHWLADQNYTHRSYADQTPSVSNAFINNDWRTLLVSGLRGGGKGLFALDITTPSAFNNETTAAAKVMWEFTHAGLGYTFGQPTLAKLNNGAWAAIFGNGYNSDVSGESKAQLFIVNLSDGSLIRAIDTGADISTNGNCDAPTSQCNGLSTPAVVDLNGDGIADRAYAGDLQGNLWTFDLSGSSPDSWSSRLLFKAEISSTPQPITTQPAVTLHPYQKRQSSAPNTMVFFGTGQYINDNDVDNTDTQSFYGIWDDGTTVINGRSDLVQQSISTDENIPDDRRVMSNNTVNYSQAMQERGWYVDFTTESKERVIVNPIIFGRLVIFSTTIPNQNLCGFAGGSWLMVLDSNSGGQPSFTALDISGDGVFNTEDMIDGLNASGIRSADLYWQPTIIQTGSGNSGTIFLPKDNESRTNPENQGTGAENEDSRLDQIYIRGTLSSEARSSWSRFNF